MKKDRQLILTVPEGPNQWELRFYNDKWVEKCQNGNVLGCYHWTLRDETVYIYIGKDWWPADNMIRHEDDRCRFYAELFYAIAEFELLM